MDRGVWGVTLPIGSQKIRPNWAANRFLAFTFFFIFLWMLSSLSLKLWASEISTMLWIVLYRILLVTKTKSKMGLPSGGSHVGLIAHVKLLFSPAWQGIYSSSLPDLLASAVLSQCLFSNQQWEWSCLNRCRITSLLEALQCLPTFLKSRSQSPTIVFKALLTASYPSSPPATLPVHFGRQPQRPLILETFALAVPSVYNRFPSDIHVAFISSFRSLLRCHPLIPTPSFTTLLSCLLYSHGIYHQLFVSSCYLASYIIHRTFLVLFISVYPVFRIVPCI